MAKYRKLGKKTMASGKTVMKHLGSILDAVERDEKILHKYLAALEEEREKTDNVKLKYSLDYQVLVLEGVLQAVKANKRLRKC